MLAGNPLGSAFLGEPPFAGGPITIQPAAASVTFSAAAPLLGRRYFITPAAATVTFSAPAPAVLRTKISAPVASTTFSAPAPTVIETVRPTSAGRVTFDAARPGVTLDGFRIVVSPAGLATFSAAAASVTLASGVGGIPAVTFTPGTDWRLVVCDLNGRPITLVSRLARSKQLTVQLNRPRRADFVIAADDPRVNSLHTDGLPYFWPGARTMKWYRKEGTSWVLRFAGYMWAINPAERDADSSVVDIAVTCFDPMQRLLKRLCRNSAGSFASTVPFTSTPGATIAKALVDRTIQYRGPVGIQTTGTFGGSTTPQTVAYDQYTVGQALIDLTNTMTLDLTFQPVDRTDGILVSMGAVSQRGVDRPGVIFGYDAIPHSALGFNRTMSMDDFANDITLYSSQKALSAHRTAAASINTYGAYEDAQVLTEITAQDFLNTIADTEIQLRKAPRDLLAIKPVPERSPSWQADWNIGDRVNVEWASSTGAAGSGYQRIYGFRMNIDDQGFETIDELIVSADAESS
jgi:hypothetical protein